MNPKTDVLIKKLKRYIELMKNAEAIDEDVADSISRKINGIEKAIEEN